LYNGWALDAAGSSPLALVFGGGEGGEGGNNWWVPEPTGK